MPSMHLLRLFSNGTEDTNAAEPALAHADVQTRRPLSHHATNPVIRAGPVSEPGVRVPTQVRLP